MGGEQSGAGRWPGAGRQAGSQVSTSSSAAPKNEMFSSRESFRMLSNELFQIISNANSRAGKNTSAEAVDDDVHHWRVRLSDFSGELGEDLKKVETLCALPLSKIGSVVIFVCRLCMQISMCIFRM